MEWSNSASARRASKLKDPKQKPRKHVPGLAGFRWNKLAISLQRRQAPEPSSRLLEDLALDSLGLTVLAVGLENRYRVRLDEQDAQGIVTVEDLARLVVSRMRAQ